MSRIELRFKGARAREATAAAVGDPDSPLLSVVMPVHNALPYLIESIQSILNQSFHDFEFIILDDGSTDGSGQVLRQWAARDARIRLHVNKERSGLSQSSNTVVSLARAPVVARMDADDISDRHRLERQWEAMQRYTEVVLVGTLSEGIDSQGKLMRPRDRWRLARKSPFPPFPHGSVMFRRNIFEQLGGYREECVGWEDQELFLRMAAKGLVAVLPEALYRYRYHTNSATLSFSTDELARLGELRARCLARQRAGHGYVDLLSKRAAPALSSDSRIVALQRAGALHLWAGEVSPLLRQIVERDDLPWSIEKLRALIWATWGTLTPGTLRFVLCCLIRARDFLIGFRVKDGRLYEWRFQ